MSKPKRFLGFGPPCTAEFVFSDGATRRKTETDVSGEKSTLFVFHRDDSVTGEVRVTPLPGKKIEHIGVRIELIGQIIIVSDTTEKFEFTSIVRTVSDSGVIGEVCNFPFDFTAVEKPNESYNGTNARLRYFLRFVVARSYQPNIVVEQDFWVEHLFPEPEINAGVKMEVGVEDSLHIEFEFNKTKYHTKDVVLGKIYFLLVRAKLKRGEISLVRRESTGAGQNVFNENETLGRFEVMDGMPVKGESIPVRFFLAPFPLTPTYRNVNNKFSVRYFLNLVLVDEDDRRYFKQQEIIIWRKS